MSQSVATHVEIRPNHSGQPRAFIAGTRIRVQDIYALAELQGKSADEIVQALPMLTLSQVHAALSYYFDHRDEILGELREDEQTVAALRAQLGEDPLARKLNSAE